MATTTELRDEALAYQFSSARYGDRMVNWFNDAQRDICRRVRIRLNQNTETTSVIASQSVITLPTDMARIISVYRTEGTGREDLTQINLNYYDTAFDTTSAGPPEAYATDTSNIYLLPLSDGDYDIYVRYYKFPDDLSLAGSNPTLPDIVNPVLIDYALFRAYASEHDTTHSRVHKDLYEEGIGRLQADLQFDVEDPPHVVEGTWGPDLSSYNH